MTYDIAIVALEWFWVEGPFVDSDARVAYINFSVFQNLVVGLFIIGDDLDSVGWLISALFEDSFDCAVVYFYIIYIGSGV